MPVTDLAVAPLNARNRSRRLPDHCSGATIGTKFADKMTTHETQAVQTIGLHRRAADSGSARAGRQGVENEIRKPEASYRAVSIERARVCGRCILRFRGARNRLPAFCSWHDHSEPSRALLLVRPLSVSPRVLTSSRPKRLARSAVFGIVPGECGSPSASATLRPSSQHARCACSSRDLSRLIDSAPPATELTSAASCYTGSFWRRSRIAQWQLNFVKPGPL